MRRITDIIKSLNEDSSLPTASLQNSQFVPNALAILKPGFTEYEDDFKRILADNDWKIISSKTMHLSDDQAQDLYRMHSKKEFYKKLCDYMSSGNIKAYACFKDTKDPVKDMSRLKDNVRKAWGKDEMKNAMHSSDTKENTKRELSIIFGDNIKESIDIPVEIPSDTIVDTKSAIILDLKSLYAEEIFAFYQYFVVYEFLVGRERPSISNKFKEFAMDELDDHASKLLKRLNELGADITGITTLYGLNEIAKNSFIVPDASCTTEVALQQNIEAETGAIDHYKSAIALAEGVDPTTAEMLKDILADEEEHLSELRDFTNDILVGHQDNI